MRPRGINFLTNAASSASALFIPIYAHTLGATPEQLGFIVASYNAFILFANVIFGRATDTQGARKILRLGLLLSAFAAFTQPFAFDAVTLVLSRAFLGFCIGMYPAALLSYAKNADRLMGKFSSYGSLGWALGNLIAGVVAWLYPGLFWQVFAVSSGLFFLAFFGSTKAPLEVDETLKVPLFPRTLIRRNLPVYLTIFIRHAGANMVWVIFPLFLQQIRHFDDLQIGLIYAFNPFVQFVVMQRIDRYRSTPLVIVGLVGSILTFLLFLVAVDFTSMFLAQILLGFSWATLYVGSLKFVMERNPETGTATGWFNSVLSFASIVGPISGGFLAAIDLTLPIYAAAILAAVALVQYAFQIGLIRRPSRPIRPVPVRPSI